MNSHKTPLRFALGATALALVGVGVYALYLPFEWSTPLAAGSGLALLALLAWTRRLLLPRRNGRNVLLIDGHCILCHGIVRLALRHDTRGEYYFAHLQSDYGRAARHRHAEDEDDIDSVYLLVAEGTPDEQLLIDGAAGRHLWPSLFWPLTPMLLLPVALLNPSYTMLARVRYRLFGRYERCHAPTAEERERFVTGTGRPATGSGTVETTEALTAAGR